ncbi:MAG: AAA-type ATPase lid domain-containing protein, partial [Planctomycetota bacterium]
MARHFLAEARERNDGRGPHTFSVEAMVLLRHYGWPGNARELRNVIERVAALSQVDEVGPEHLPPAVQGLIGGEPAPAAGDAPLKEALARYERRYLEHLLETVQGNVSEAARRAGVSRPS